MDSIFRNRQAAWLAAKAYRLEDQRDWVVYVRRDPDGDVFYRVAIRDHPYVGGWGVLDE